MLEALRQSLGVVETACKAAGVGRRTHYDWLEKDAKYAQQVDEVAQVSVDFGETMLHKLMKGYTVPDSKVFLIDHIEVKGGKTVTTKKPLVVPITKHIGTDASAVIFFLKTKGKHRGYVERSELTGKDGAPIAPAPVHVTVQVLPSGPALASSEKEVVE